MALRLDMDDVRRCRRAGEFRQIELAQPVRHLSPRNGLAPQTCCARKRGRHEDLSSGIKCFGRQHTAHFLRNLPGKAEHRPI